MCHWNACFGQPVMVDELLFKTDHGLIDQSLRSRIGVETTDGDGFGLGCYGTNGARPGRYRSTTPAWSDVNLRDLAANVESPLFLAHIRATTGTPVQQTNCHPSAGPLAVRPQRRDRRLPGDAPGAAAGGGARAVPRRRTDEDRIVVSEPPGDLAGAWLATPKSTALIIQPGARRTTAIQPAPALEIWRITMSTPGRGVQEAQGAFDEAGGGWILFAGIMLMLVGILNVIWGIAAIGDSSFFVNDQKYILSNLNTWGWVTLILGAVQIAAAYSIWAGNQFGRWFGIGVAGLSAIGALMSLPAYPFWSLAIFAVDILVIYGLAAYGGQHRSL
jgi:hypothetical protein